MYPLMYVIVKNPKATSGRKTPAWLGQRHMTSRSRKSISIKEIRNMISNLTILENILSITSFSMINVKYYHTYIIFKIFMESLLYESNAILNIRMCMILEIPKTGTLDFKQLPFWLEKMHLIMGKCVSHT